MKIITHKSFKKIKAPAKTPVKPAPKKPESKPYGTEKEN